MQTNDELLDRNILSNFQNIFKAMNIRDYQIVTAIQNISLPTLDFETREQLLNDGLIAAENFADEWIEIAEPQLHFKYKKHVVIMYQRDQFLTQADYNNGRYRPFHLSFCSALQSAHEKNRYESRYVMTYNPNGNFKVNLFVRDTDSDGKVYTLKKEQEVYRPLKVCQHCLREINWKHFRQYCGSGLEWWRGGNSYQRYKIVDEFNLEEYFVTARQNNFFDHPVLGTASSSIKKEYVLTPSIKDELKKIVEYTCEICRNKFSPEELQIHHKNHNEGDNRRQNLMVVCEHCHGLIHEAEGGFVSRRENSKPVEVTATKSNKPLDIAAEKYFEERYSEEYAIQQKSLGDMIFNGLGVPKDEQRAQIFYRRAFDSYKVLAQKQDVDAWFELANFYRLGLGVEKNLEEANRRFVNIFPRYKARADKGDIKAKVRLGLMYAQGLGVEKNIDAAKKIIDEIRRDGDVVGNELVELCLLVGNIDDAMKFHAKALQLFEIAADNGDKIAKLELATLYNKALIGEDFND